MKKYAMLVVLVACGGRNESDRPVSPQTDAGTFTPDAETDAGEEASTAPLPEEDAGEDADASCPGLTDPCSCRVRLDACQTLNPQADCGFLPSCQEAEPWYPVPVCGPGKSHRIGGRDGCTQIGDVMCCTH